MKYAIVYDVAEDRYKIAPYSNFLGLVAATFDVDKYADEYDFWLVANELYCKGMLFRLNVVLDFVKDKYPSLFPLARTSFYNYALRTKEQLDILLIVLEDENVTS